MPLPARSGSVRRLGRREARFARTRVSRPVPAREPGRGTAGVPLGSVAGSPRLLVARSAMTAAASRKNAQASRARWKPAVSAASRGACAASSALVRAVAMAEKIARPRAVPSCWEAFSRPAASPALSAGTPALAAVVTETRTAPIPMRHDHQPGEQVRGVGAVDRDAGQVPDPGGGDQRAGDDHRAGADAGEQPGGDSRRRRRCRR